MQQSIIFILISSAALHFYAAHAAAKLQQLEQVNLTESTQIFRHNNNNNYNVVVDGADSGRCNQVDAIIVGSRNVGKKQHENELLLLARKPLQQVKVTNEVESSSSGNIELNLANGNHTTTTTTPRNTLMSQSVPLIQRHKFGQPHRQFSTQFGNSSTLRGVDAVVAQQHVSSSAQAAEAVVGSAEHDDDQLLRLQDYNLLYNAERHTNFQLHTNLTAFKLKLNATMATGAMAMATATSAGIKRSRGRGRQRSLHNIVGNTLNAAFGFNAGHMPGQTFDELQVETVQLYDAISLRQTRFNPFKPTRILIHGWLGNANANMYAALVPAYLQQLHTGDYNIITVDWGRGALADYITASYRVKPVGKVLAKFIDFLHQEAGMRFEDLQLIGFSMGAHIAGIAGKHVQTGHLRVIRALDPALPFFRYAAEAERLTSNDALYVEVLHTSVGSYGFDRPIGHADFYANWGSTQPGCFWYECSHWRAFQLFGESLRTAEVQATTKGEQRQRQRQFMAQGCAPEDWQQLTRYKRCPHLIDRQQSMGGDLTIVNALGELVGDVDLMARHGVYYFQTNANAPFAIG